MALLLGAATVAGLVGLAGLYAMASSRRRDQARRQYPRRTCHTCRRRYHRSLKEESLAVEQALEDIRRQDVSGCGMKLVCDLASLSPEDLTAEEWGILDLIRTGEAGGGGGGGVRAYGAARQLGEWGGMCEAAFPGCPYTTSELMDTFMAFLP